ncbi:DUF3574 domain-containing protein [Solimonas variicoloris]|uniref:DUF3574 domain-containing protein n=1 Tax=Solimonas variicoloris TaxID=254408 RepID=UPI00038283C0|nr:DUF3574 domain-containing protein [Solimonas variicoloris]
MRIACFALALAAALPSAHVQAASAADAAPVSHAMIRSELYFAAVDAAQWDDFLATVVTPRFPDGLSWYDVHGQWRGPSGGPEKLPSRIVVILHADNPANERALDEISQRFRQRFGYSVLRTAAAVRASDPDWTEARVREHPQLSPTR